MPRLLSVIRLDLDFVSLVLIMVENEFASAVLIDRGSNMECCYSSTVLVLVFRFGSSANWSKDALSKRHNVVEVHLIRKMDSFPILERLVFVFVTIFDPELLVLVADFGYKRLNTTDYLWAVVS